MAFLESLWEAIGIFFGGILRSVERGITSIFGSSNARQLKKYYSRVEKINGLESRYQAMSDDELAEQTNVFRQRLRNGETLDDILEEAFAVCREAGWRFLQMRHYDVQLIGGMVLHSGSIAEMITGEGKTLVATLPAYLNAVEGRGVHVVTVNDYLARRDMEWMAPLYMGLGLTVGAIQSDMRVLDRQEAYAKDITYGTNNEFGFDYLRDNMRSAARGDDGFPKEQQQSQGFLNFAIVDEVDNILIDEARTPLIISGPAYDNLRKYGDADKIARQLKKGEHFNVSEKDHSVTLTDNGVRAAERLAGVESFYTAGNMEWPHLIDNSLKAHYLYKKDVNYVVKEGKVIIVDEFTGRLMDGRQWSDGLHQAVEAKENVKIKEETQTLATITLQNFFKLYRKISGMTGTAMTEANEFWKIYKLDVVAIPPNRHLQRIEHADVIYCTEREKYQAVAEEIERTVKWDVLTNRDGDRWGIIHKETDDTIEFQEQGSNKKEKLNKGDFSKIERKGRPVLVGTVSIEKSERISQLLDKSGIKHEVLNAKHHRREADIVAQAGRMGAVTIATNMAGRGTDIVLGGNPETLAWSRLQDTYETRLDVPREEWDALVDEIDKEYNMAPQGEEVKELGGLHVVATERHEARRIDLQLRGRCGRQGDPGSSRFFLSLEDDLMRIFAGPWVKSILERLGMRDGERIESRLVTRRIEAAQKKVEERNFEIRKNLLEYDEVMDEQRKRVYSYRQQILDGVNCRDLILDTIQTQIDFHIDEFLAQDYGIESFAEWASSQLATRLEGKDFRGMDFRGAEAFAIDQAQRNAEREIYDALDENLPQDEEPGDWRWEAMANSVSRWGVSVRDRALKKIGDRDEVADHLIQESSTALSKINLSEGEVLLEEDFPIRTALAWVKAKFDIELEFDEVSGLGPAELKDKIRESAEKLYDEKESMYPVIVGFQHYAKGQGIDREALVEWAAARFSADLSLDDVKNKQRDEVRTVLHAASQKHLREGINKLDAVRSQLDTLFGATEKANINGALTTLSDWFRSELDYELDLEELRRLDPEQLRNRLTSYVERRYRPEMRRLERTILLQIVDGAWKDHLLVMDHLRNSVGLMGWGQMDPKVEYKREGMKLFDSMWQSVEERVSDLVFRIEQMDDDVVQDTWSGASAHHEEAESTGDIVRQQEEAINASQQDSEGKVDPIRNTGPRVGRNDPCPCDSGKKYKNCCMRKRATSDLD